MLNRIEKKELLEDALSIKRRDAFRKGKVTAGASISLDTYIQFLSKVHNVFSSVDIIRQENFARHRL